MTPSWLSSTSPLPVISKLTVGSATSMDASRRLKYLSVLHPLASSTQLRVSCPGYSSIFPSRRSRSVKASAVAPANPTMTPPSSAAPSPPSLSPPPPIRSRSDLVAMRRTFLALGLMVTFPMETIPSPTMHTLPSFRTQRIVVECQSAEPNLAGAAWEFDRGADAEYHLEEREAEAAAAEVRSAGADHGESRGAAAAARESSGARLATWLRGFNSMVM
mmetsp:Transcript_131/g.257  ORF Transcript_131/g.257 Transcript_131/m.257 type:complete len:218 (-) Transcript_131:69-722(-)